MRSLAFSLLPLLLCLAAVPRGSSASHGGDQPLANIAIHLARIALDSSAYIKASPYVLGQKGEDTELVTVEFFSPNATSNDWIGVFSPANFNSSICPAVNVEGQDPDICTAPIKYQFANYSSGYVGTGKGSIKFQLINQRSDFSFALFTGGLSKPSLIAVSNTIAFKNPKAPVYPRLAQGKEWNEMTVTWTSGYDISEAYPFVEWGMLWNPPTRTPAGTLTFNRGSLCGKFLTSVLRKVSAVNNEVYVDLSGEPARTVGWRDPGFIHTSFLKDLWPDKQYYYKVGHQLKNGTIVYGKPYIFKASPFPGQNSLQRVVIFGDMGKAERDGSNEYSNYQPGSLNTTDTLVKDLDNIDIIFHIGDIVYANGYISQWDQFTAQVEPLTAKVPYMVASGNHERDWPNSGSFYTGMDSGGECGVLAETMYYVPTENRANYWYQTDYGMFRFCIADTEHDWREGTEQYKFIEKCLSTVDRKQQPWLIFIAHRVLGYSSGSFYADEGTFAEPMGRESLQQLWQKYRVDIAFYGHVHNYERTCPVYENQCVSTEKSHYSGVMNGTIHVVVGGGGSHLAGFSNSTPAWSIFRDLDYGFTKLTAFNHSSLLFEYKRSSNGNVYDSFTINRDYRDVLACVVDSCPPTTLAH